MAGGTGGHVFPGLAVAHVLRERSQPVVWLGTRRGIEARLVPEAGIEIEWISISGLRGSGWASWVSAPVRLLIALVQALGVLRRRRPSAVLGLGGFVAGPGGLAAWLARRPLVIHEQNAVAGTTNRWLARFADQVFEAFPGSFPPAVSTQVVGNPVRREIVALATPAERFRDRPLDAPLRLLVIGGSQGARVLNRTLPEALALLPAEQRPQVWHQGGVTHDEAAAAYARLELEARLEPFISDMAAAYSWADLVLCRAGALTLAELAAAGLGALLVPFPHAIDDHQTRNASHLCSAGAAVAIAERDLTPSHLAAELARLNADRNAVRRMAAAARTQAHPDAASVIANACLKLAEANR
jgi:UDP-N-acetylglucosamine--N-acetylmuramyl-(pentapeptide) pyrophosphoryl-undecaprenol N-acetylglucosamine transferase